MALKVNWIRASFGWIGLLILAFLNGAIRELAMKKMAGIEDLFAHQLSCLTGVFLWALFTWVIWDKLQIKSLKQSVCVGLGWFSATAIFETFVLNRKLSWPQVLATYDLSSGEFWGLALLSVGFMPIVICCIKNPKSEAR